MLFFYAYIFDLKVKVLPFLKLQAYIESCVHCELFKRGYFIWNRGSVMTDGGRKRNATFWFVSLISQQAGQALHSQQSQHFFHLRLGSATWGQTIHTNTLNSESLTGVKLYQLLTIESSHLSVIHCLKNVSCTSVDAMRLYLATLSNI